MAKQQVNLTGALTRHGYMLWFPTDQYVGRSLDYYGEFSTAEWWLFQQFIDDSVDVVEVGANIGAHTLPLAQRARSVIAFEPQPWLARLCAANLAMNDCKNAQVVNAACGETNGTIWMPNFNYASQNNYGGISCSGWEEKLEQHKRVQVPLVRLDSCITTNCGFLKIDVEGAEVDVLKGALSLIEDTRPVMYIENDREENSKELVDLIYSLDYRAWWHVAMLHYDENFYNASDNIMGSEASFNIVCLPKERADTIDGIECTPENCMPPFGADLDIKYAGPVRTTNG